MDLKFNSIYVISDLVFADEAARVFISLWVKAKTAASTKWSCSGWDPIQCSSDQLPCTLRWNAGTPKYLFFFLLNFFFLLKKCGSSSFIWSICYGDFPIV